VKNGARIKYQDERLKLKYGVVHSLIGKNYLMLESGDRIWKAQVLGFDDRVEGCKEFRQRLYVMGENGVRRSVTVNVWAKDKDGAAKRAKELWYKYVKMDVDIGGCKEVSK
jgi:hypothetical protein